MKNVSQDRIEWIDIYKGLAIILVVIGHATGLFNSYIYQFHVAAFFFISGWCAKIDKNSFLKDLYKKAMTLIVPLLSLVIIFGGITNLMNICGIYKYFCEDVDLISIGESVNNFVKTGSMMNLMGAAWFVVVLFSVSLLSHFLYIILFHNKYAFIIASVYVYIYGYYMMRNGDVLNYSMDIAFVAQGYYGVGFFLRKQIPTVPLPKNKRNIFIFFIVFAITSLNMKSLSFLPGGMQVMDLANRKISSFGWSTLAVCNGILWLYALSQMISLFNHSIVKKWLMEIGQNTMGIMLFHFMFFRIVAVLLFLFGVVNVSELKNLIPSSNVKDVFLPVYILVSLCGSVIIWKGITKIPVLKQLLGRDTLFINNVLETQPIKEFTETYHEITYSIEKAIKQDSKPKNIVIGIPLLSVLGLILFCKYIPLMERAEIKGVVQATFPYTENLIQFEDGWLEQSENEAYRWIRKESTFEVPLADQKTIKIEGYVPAETNASHVDLYLNEVLIDGCNIDKEHQLILEGPVSEYLQNGMDTFKIIFDGEKKLTADDIDQRIFSAMVTSIEIK